MPELLIVVAVECNNLSLRANAVCLQRLLAVTQHVVARVVQQIHTHDTPVLWHTMLRVFRCCATTVIGVPDILILHYKRKENVRMHFYKLNEDFVFIT